MCTIELLQTNFKVYVVQPVGSDVRILHLGTASEMQIFALKMVAQARRFGSLIEFFGNVKPKQKAPE